MLTNHVTRRPGDYFATPRLHNEILSDREMSKNLKLNNNSNSFGRGCDNDHFIRNRHSMNMNMNHHSIGFSQLSKIRARPASAVRLPTFNPHQFQPQKKPNQSPVSISTQHIPPSQQPQQAQQYQHQHQAQHRQQHQHGSMNQQHVQHQQQQQHQQQHAHPAIVRRNRQMSEVSGVSSMFDGTMGNSVAIGNYHMENMENLNNVNTHYNLVSNASNSNPFRNKGNNDYHNDIINKHRLSAQLGLEIHVQESDGDSNAISPVSPGTGDNNVTVGRNYNNDPNKISLIGWDQVRSEHSLSLYDYKQHGGSLNNINLQHCSLVNSGAPGSIVNDSVVNGSVVNGGGCGGGGGHTKGRDDFRLKRFKSMIIMIIMITIKAIAMVKVKLSQI